MRRSILIGTVVVTAIAAAVVRGCDQTPADPDDSADTAPGSAAAEADVGPRPVEFGVPVGWTRDGAGAKAAAVSAVSLTGDIARAGFITREDMIGVLASQRFAPTLQDASQQQLADFTAGLAADGLLADAIVFREVPLTVHVDAVDADRARVAVWSVLIVAAPQGVAPRQLWRTVTVDPVWERGDWRIDRWAAEPGPTPVLAVESEVASFEAIEAVTAWPAAGA